MSVQIGLRSTSDAEIADFVHTYRGGALRTQTIERGHVLIKKPGLMRWTYTVA